jgi:hypothetical protein
MTGTIASPVALWREDPSSGAALALTRLTPYLGTDGVWVFLGARDAVPVGAVAGVMLMDNNGVNVPTLDATIGQRLTAGPTGEVFVYGQVQLFRYVVGDALPVGAFSRASTAEYTNESSTPLYRYAAGDVLTPFSRASVATYTGEV